MLSRVSGGKLMQVLGDPRHGYTRGSLCAKGYSLIQYSLDESRLKYPLKQVRRGSGEWRRISWDQAYSEISDKMFSLVDRYGSGLCMGYYTGEGNKGVLHQAVRGMFEGLGRHTRPMGDICSGTGSRALWGTEGDLPHPDPERVSDAGAVVLWGSNPAVTNINQMRLLYEARVKSGTPVIVIDPLLTLTAEKADAFVQINPGTDGWLALGVAKSLIDSGKIDVDLAFRSSSGLAEFLECLEDVTIDEVCERTGVSCEGLEYISEVYAGRKPVASFLGFGMQRYRWAGESVKAISALTALSGSYGIPGGGVYFSRKGTDPFLHLFDGFSSADSEGPIHREVPANDFARRALELDDPPLKMLWISCGNPLAQDHNIKL
ncbi:MAG: molybdopterin-dependent oxidoreductase, partial [Eggerthellaceae bacterium]|nr:molybdopterin-dependent oxidoreductase [Eggerthellaceae bacterium]